MRRGSNAGKELPPSALKAIVAAVADDCGLTPGRILGPQRGFDLVEARFAAIWLAKRIYGCGLSPLGRAFSRDHSTIHHALYAVEIRRQREPAYAARLDRLLASLREQPSLRGGRQPDEAIQNPGQPRAGRGRPSL